MNEAPVMSDASPGELESWQAQHDWALPLRRVAAAQIVFDGARRLLWSNRGPAAWRPERIWPSAAERDGVLADLGSGRPTLIVLEPESVPVPVLPEELDRAPRRLRDRAVGLGGDEYAVPITLLDWLPQQYRRRGLEFLRLSRRIIESNPKLLLSSFIADEATQPGEALRFALRASTRVVSDRDLAVFCATLFPAHGAVPRPRSAG